MSRFSILLQTLTCGLSRQEPTLDIPVPAVLTAETVADEILDEDEEFVLIPIMDEEGSDLLTIGNAIPSSYAQEGAATVAAGQNLIAEREFTDPTGHDEDIEVDEIFAACRSLSINLYNHFGTKGKIGSLHTGKVMLSMTESELVGQPGHWIRHLAPARTDMNIAGGQCYMPAFLHHLLGKQRKDTKEVAGFPMMLTRALLRYNAGFDCDRNKHLAELSQRWVPINAMARRAEAAIKNSFPSVLRFEFFFGTTLEQEDCDFKFPDIPYLDITHVLLHDEFTARWAADISENRKPLDLLMHDVFTKLQDTNSEFKLEHFPPDIKTRLLLHAEQLLMNLQIKTYFGAITKKIFDCLHVDPSRKLFYIPDGLRRPFPEGADRPYDLDFGLDPKLLSLPQYTGIEDMEVNLRRAPRHIQQLQGQMRNIVQSPNAYYHYTGKALRMLLSSSSPTGNALNVGQEFGLFENPDYNTVASLPVEQKVILIENLARVVWDMYDVEWWLMITEYAKVSVDHRNFATTRPYRRKLNTFPRTVDSFDMWEAEYGSRSSFFTLSRNFNQNLPEIVTNGKFASRFDTLKSEFRFLACFHCFMISFFVIFELRFHTLKSELRFLACVSEHSHHMFCFLFYQNNLLRIVFGMLQRMDRQRTQKVDG
jgi:hypothetical protein